MQSAAKCPFLLSFVTETWNGPDESLKNHGVISNHDSQIKDFIPLHSSHG